MFHVRSPLHLEGLNLGVAARALMPKLRAFSMQRLPGLPLR